MEASVGKNEESPTEDLATKVDAYLPGPSSVTIPETKTAENPVLSQEECEALIKEYFPQGKVHTTTLVSTNARKSVNRSYEEFSQRNLTMAGWKKSTDGGFVTWRGKECIA